MYLAYMSTVLDEKNLTLFSLFDGFQGFAALKLEALHFFPPLPVFRLSSAFTMHRDEGFMQSDFCSGEKGTRNLQSVLVFVFTE